MFFKSRFIHFQSNILGNKYNGFSVRLSPSYDPSLVDFQYTLCSRKDQFCKKKAREQLYNTAAVMSIPIRSLPDTLAALEFKVYGQENLLKRVDHKHVSNHWAWIWKYFV